MANDNTTGKFYTTTSDGRWKALGHLASSTPITVTTVPEFDTFTDWDGSIKTISKAYTATLNLNYSALSQYEFSVGSRAEHAVLNMCFALLDAMGLWTGLCCSTDRESGRTYYFAMDDDGVKVVKLVQNKLNTIARSFPADTAIELCDDMVAAWKKGVPALDVLA